MARLLSFSAFFLVLAASFVCSLGIVSDYLEENTLELPEGTSKLYSIRLQNPQETNAAVTLSYDRTFLAVIGEKEQYIVPAKGNLRIVFNVTAPSVEGNQTHDISYTIR